MKNVNMDLSVTGNVARSANSVAQNLAKENIAITNKILEVIKTGATKSNKSGMKLTYGMRQSLQKALKNLTNPSQRALLIKAVGDAFASGAIGVGSGFAEIATSIVTPIMTSKTERARIASETSKQAIAAGKEVALRAIEAGVWNSGITGLPYNSDTTQGQNGNSSGGQDDTTGSFLGG